MFAFMWVNSGLLPAAELVRQWQAWPARLYEVRGSQRRLLDRMEHFLEKERWDEAFDIAVRILQSESSSVVAVDQHHYVGLREYCHRLIAELPPGPLARYQELVDTTAEAWYRRGVAERDESFLQRVVDRNFCSRWGDDALWALGEFALERGDYSQARSCWQRLNSELKDSDQTLVFPDSERELAEIRARLLLVSLREQNWQRAEKELATLQSLHPQARGRIGGREVVYAEYLAALLKQAQDNVLSMTSTHWSTFAGGPHRANIAVVSESNFEEHFSVVLKGAFETYPVIHDGQVIYQDMAGIHVLELSSGREKFSVAMKEAATASQPMLGRAIATLSASKHLVLGATRLSFDQLQSSTLWGIDLRRDGAFTFQILNEEKSTQFAGAPLVQEDRVFVAIRENLRTARVGIACYDLASEKLCWRRWLCQANTPATGWNQDLTTTLLTMDSGRIYLSTNLGAIAAVSAHDGQVLWLHSYDRMATPLSSKGRSTYYRGPNPAVYYHGRLFVLPTDGKQLFSLDVVTGRRQWSFPLSTDDGLLEAAVYGKLVLSDGGLKILDANTGDILYRNEKLQLEGRAAILGQRILWPSDGKIHVIDLPTGKSIDRAISLPISGRAHLAATNGFLVVTQPDRLTVLRSLGSSPVETNVSQFP